MDAYWHIPNTSWPATANDDELTSDQVLDVLDQISEYYPAALASLAETPVPQHPTLGDHP
jgi:hypothetical protein